MTDRIQTIVELKNGPTITKWWIPAECCCVGCGAINVWVEDAVGDYYHGPTYLCITCGTLFCIGIRRHATDRLPSDKLTWEQIRQKIIDAPVKYEVQEK